ncbi:beta-sarcoglycan [Elysia marginata]|uniref:Beta-sarcoglycan n=1 Tax=Elysia marginata TaxID=1093978 RepID=A0AAV4EJA3_9GAST|nr:beta-sarcoglycan [Elysia marginata]
MATNGAAGYSSQRSPLALSGNLGASTLSMRAKAARKRKINSRHNSNFHAGFVPVDEDRLQRSGIRGRKRYFLFCLVGTLMAVTFLNLAITAWLLHILGMTHHGLQSVEMISRGSENLMRVLTDASIDTISLDNAMLGARFDSNLDMQAEESALTVKTASRNSSSSITLEGNKLTLTTGEFCVKTTNSPDWVSANLASMARQNIINNLSVDDNITVGKIQEGIKYSDLSIESTTGDTNIFGRDGVQVATAKQIQVSAKSDSVSLKAQHTINMEGSRGIYIRPRMKKVKKGKTFKVCICDTGRVFFVKGKSSCDLSDRKRQEICGDQNGQRQTARKSSKSIFF